MAKCYILYLPLYVYVFFFLATLTDGFRLVYIDNYKAVNKLLLKEIDR